MRLRSPQLGSVELAAAALPGRITVIGFAPHRPANLVTILQKRGLLEPALKLGLAKHDNNGTCHDMFRARLMFPIRDAQGHVIAFGGRVLDNRLPKYINSAESPFYSKARAQILHLLCEGNSIRAVTRLTGASKNTVSKLMIDAGKACAWYHDEHVRNLTAAENRYKFSRMLDTIEVDQPTWKELTSFEEAKEFCSRVSYPVLFR